MVRQRAVIFLMGVLGLLVWVAAANSNTNNVMPPPPPPQAGMIDGPQQGPPPPPPNPEGRRKGGPPPLFIQDERFRKMLDLALLPESDVEQNIDKLPMANKMDDKEKEKFADHIRNFRNRIRKTALDEAKKLQLNLPQEKEDEFIKDFWEKRIEMEKKLNEEMEPRRKKMMKEIKEDLSKKYTLFRVSN